jgi:CRISPR/Cas system-associated protein Csm6
MSENSAVCLVYANKLNPMRDAFREIASLHGGKKVRREYIVPSGEVTPEDVYYFGIKERLEEIQESLEDGEEMVIVLAGYSPLVAVLYMAAHSLGLKQVYYIRDAESRKFREMLME